MNSSPVALVLVLSLFVGLHALDPPNVLNVEYNTSFHSFSDVYPLFYNQLTSYTAHPPSVRGRLFLAPRRPVFSSLPRVFVMLNMASHVRHQKATMAFCLDDLYSWGFKNRSGHWHTLSRFEEIVPGSSFAPFGYSYPELLPPLPGTSNNIHEKNSHLRLVTVKLGREAAAAAFRTLANYRRGRILLVDLKSAYLTLTLTFGEGLRFAKFNARLQAEWDTVGGFYMTPMEAESVVLYGLVSHQLDWWAGDPDPRKCEWRTDWLPELKTINANTAQGALDTILLVLRYRPGEKEKNRHKKGMPGRPPSSYSAPSSAVAVAGEKEKNEEEQ